MKFLKSKASVVSTKQKISSYSAIKIIPKFLPPNILKAHLHNRSEQSGIPKVIIPEYKFKTYENNNLLESKPRFLKLVISKNGSIPIMEKNGNIFTNIITFDNFKKITDNIYKPIVRKPIKYEIQDFDRYENYFYKSSKAVIESGLQIKKLEIQCGKSDGIIFETFDINAKQFGKFYKFIEENEGNLVFDKNGHKYEEIVLMDNFKKIEKINKIVLNLYLGKR